MHHLPAMGGDTPRVLFNFVRLVLEMLNRWCGMDADPTL